MKFILTLVFSCLVAFAISTNLEGVPPVGQKVGQSAVQQPFVNQVGQKGDQNQMGVQASQFAGNPYVGANNGFGGYPYGMGGYPYGMGGYPYGVGASAFGLGATPFIGAYETAIPWIGAGYDDWGYGYGNGYGNGFGYGRGNHGGHGHHGRRGHHGGRHH